MNNEIKKSKTQLSKSHRFPISVNARKYDGEKVIYSCVTDPKTGAETVRYLDQNTENGGTMTPFNIQCNCAGSPAIRNIVLNGDSTIVVFADGDRVVLTRHEGDANDPVTAVLWALGQKVFGKGLVRQIHNALQYRAIDAAKEHEKKAAEKKNK